MNEADQDREPVTLLDVVDAATARLWEGAEAAFNQPQFSYAQLKRLAAGIDLPSAHAETLSRVAQAVTEAGAGWIEIGDDITDSDTAAAVVVADRSSTCLLVCIPVPAGMTAEKIRVQVDTEIAVNLGALRR